MSAGLTRLPLISPPGNKVECTFAYTSFDLNNNDVDASKPESQ
jgi:hypothetical protein